MTPRQTPPRRPCNAAARRAQQGFITGAAQVTLALVSMVVGAAAFSLDGARQQAADQIAHVHASYLMKVGADLETALTRASVDNGLSRGEMRGTITLDSSAGSRSQVALFDSQLGYGGLPRWPSGLLVEGVAGAGGLRWAESGGHVIEVVGIDLAVCRRFNEMLQGTDPERAPPADFETARRDRGWTQGCWAEEGAEAGTWFKEAFADTHCRGAACRKGDGVGASARQMIAALAESAPESAPAPDSEAVRSPLDAFVECVTREAAAGIRDPQVVAARCTVSS